MKIPKILDQILSPEDMTSVMEIATANAQRLGVKYNRFITSVVTVIRNNYPPSNRFDDEELQTIVAVADTIGHGSRGMMKRLKEACNGCGWCCSQTNRIVINEADANRISRKLKIAREELFVLDGEDWIMKKVKPCRWWNPRNGRCFIYNERPQTCRTWPLGISDEGINTIITQSECNYAVMVSAQSAIGLLESANMDELKA